MRSILQERTQESAGILRRTPHATLSRSEPHKESRRRKDLSEERRPPSRRSTQDQQHAGTSPPRQTNGKEESHRGNRGWAARRCNGHGMRRSRSTIRDIHGSRRYGKAEAQRLPDEIAGGQVHPVDSGSRTLKDAINESLRDWVTNVENTYYLLGSAVGPHPYPTIVRDFQSIIGREARQQILAREDKLPSAIIACVGGGSNSIGIFHHFLHDLEVELYGVEAGGQDIRPGQHAAALVAGSEGVLHGMLTYLLQDTNGQVQNTRSISAGLDYPAVGPEHAYLKNTGRVKYSAVSDDDALDAFKRLSNQEGIMPALEPAHALSYAFRLAKKYPTKDSILVNLSGRGDKDVEIAARHFIQ